MSIEVICNYYRVGHCKFGDVCKKSHQIETCGEFPCHDDSCLKRHPPICKFYSRFGRCKFDQNCSYLHRNPSCGCLHKNSTNEVIKEVNILKAQHEVMQTAISKLENYITQFIAKTNEIEASYNCMDTSVAAQNGIRCTYCSATFASKDELKKHDQSHQNPHELFKCEFCKFVSKSQKGLNVHRSTVHKNSLLSRTLPTSYTSEHHQSPINCIRHANGCNNVIYSYYNKYTAICDSCLDYLEKKLKMTPFSHKLCPCCHKPSLGTPLSLCAECMDDINSEEGYTESRWVAWHLDRMKNRIVCISLDFN